MPVLINLKQKLKMPAIGKSNFLHYYTRSKEIIVQHKREKIEGQTWVYKRRR